MLPWVAAAVRELVEETGIWLLESGTVVTSDRPSDEAVFSDVLDREECFAGDALHKKTCILVNENAHGGSPIATIPHGIAEV